MKIDRGYAASGLTAILLLAMNLAGRAESPEEAFQAAQTAFAEANTPARYRAVAARYQALLDAGHVSSTVYFNQGNAFAAAGDWARAIASYQRAAKLDPLDADIAANLAFARDKLMLPSEPSWKEAARWLSWPSPPLQALLLVALGFVAILSRGLALARVAPSILDRVAHGCLVGGLALAIIMAIQWAVWDRTERAVIVQADVPLRRGESVSFPALPGGSLPAGAEVTVLEQRGDWLRVRPDQGLNQQSEGWLPRSAVVTY